MIPVPEQSVDISCEISGSSVQLGDAVHRVNVESTDCNKDQYKNQTCDTHRDTSLSMFYFLEFYHIFF